MKHILLDSFLLGLLSIPARTAEAIAISEWATDCLSAGHKIYIPEVIDYELRRELLRAGKVRSVSKLDALKAVLRYLPITTPVMLRAADLWASSRKSGFPTGDPKKLDIDVILSAQALTLPEPPSTIIVATSNVSHIARFAPADLWSNISP